SPPDAVVAATVRMAWGSLFAVGEGGGRVPGVLALAVFAVVPLSRYVPPPLTTMRVEFAELGALAIRRLLEAGTEETGGGDVGPRLLRPRRGERASCGAVPDTG